MTAQEEVLKFLKNGRSTHSALDRMLRLKGIVTYNLADVIYRLRKKGHYIETYRYKYRGKYCTSWELIT